MAQSKTVVEFFLQIFKDSKDVQKWDAGRHFRKPSIVTEAS